jgi:hypothetical protein
LLKEAVKQQSAKMFIEVHCVKSSFRILEETKPLVSVSVISYLHKGNCPVALIHPPMKNPNYITTIENHHHDWDMSSLFYPKRNSKHNFQILPNPNVRIQLLDPPSPMGGINHQFKMEDDRFMTLPTANHGSMFFLQEKVIKYDK